MARFASLDCWIGFIGLVMVILGSSVSVGDKSAAKQETASTSAPDVRRHICCARHQKIVDVGHGISGEVIQVDAGYCKSFCPRHFVDDPGDPSRPAVQKCMPNMHCRPRTARLERISTIEGVRGIEVVDTCDCSTGHPCKRDAYLQTLHVGTPYQFELDVGACVGFCKKYSCRPSRNSTVSVRGPNGDEVYQVINKCSCAGSCHRMDHYETILDFSGVEIKGSTNIADAVPNVRNINVGQCVGSCSSNSTETCLLRDKTNPIKCLAGLYTGEQSCTSAKFKVHEYRTRRGQKREIIQITQCACV
ncbi:uncharacterized protein LOC106642873 [Copidosoma floridanum]|uniref:uncharacterized protein LOC106642873 n=1 Tax=Copidosoma floridanum TaxID=29053 RepID=UPI0006C99738|nr:uncharacterized protein LOC106642873 [Copidosoma floridanum]